MYRETHMEEFQSYNLEYYMKRLVGVLQDAFILLFHKITPPQNTPFWCNL